MIEFATCALLLTGTFFMVVSSLGLMRLPDLYGRLHAVTKATTLGMAGILAGSTLYFQNYGEGGGVAELIVMLFLLLTNPAGGHMLGRAAYLTGVPMTDESVMDQMDRAGEKAGAGHDQD